MKRSLENRLRGWFPQEPYLFSRNCRVETSLKKPPLMIRPEYTVSATKFMGLLAIFWIVFYGFLFFSNFNLLKEYPVSVLQLTSWIILGVIIGIVSWVVYTRRELCRLTRTFQINVNLKDMVFIILLPVLAFFFPALFARHIIGLSFAALYFSSYAWGVSSVLTRYGLFLFYEKIENMRIMTSWFGPSGFAVIPKPPKQEKRPALGSELKQA